MYQMTEEQKAERSKQKKIHQAIRSLPEGRYRNLAWGFVRGFKYRRIERTTHTQTLSDGRVIEHNRPSARVLEDIFEELLPVTYAVLTAWIDDPSGAIPAPPPRPKKPFVPAAE